MGGDLHELVDAEQIGRLFAVLAFALPPLCLICGWWYGSRRRAPRLWAVYGLLVGLLGPLNFTLWRMYNAITDAVGLDTVRNLVINLVVFLVVGVIVGAGVGFAVRRMPAPADTGSPTDKAP